MIRCVAVDDEVNALRVIEMYAGKLPKLDLLDTFTDPVQAAGFIEKTSVDLVFLDINMKSLNGFELLESLTHPPQVIFTTAYSEYAVKSYSVDALDYLMKPFAFSRFLKAINKFDALGQAAERTVKEVVSQKEEIISVKSGSIIHRIRVDDILYLEADGNYTKFVTTKEVVMFLGTMSESLAKLDDHQFIQTHRSYAVAISKVSKVEPNQLSIAEVKLPISSSFRSQVLDRIV